MLVKLTVTLGPVVPLVRRTPYQTTFPKRTISVSVRQPQQNGATKSKANYYCADNKGGLPGVMLALSLIRKHIPCRVVLFAGHPPRHPHYPLLLPPPFPLSCSVSRRRSLSQRQCPESALSTLSVTPGRPHIRASVAQRFRAPRHCPSPYHQPPFRRLHLNLSSSSFSCRRSFSSDRSSMAGTKIDGTAIAKGIRDRLNADIKERQLSNPRFKPSLVIFQSKD